MQISLNRALAEFNLFARQDDEQAIARCRRQQLVDAAPAIQIAGDETRFRGGLLRKLRLRFAGETMRIDEFELWFAPRRPELPIYVSAVFPKGIALCGEIADGIILTRSTLATAATVRAGLAEAAERAGRDPGAVTLTTLLPAAVGETPKSFVAVAFA